MDIQIPLQKWSNTNTSVGRDTFCSKSTGFRHIWAGQTRNGLPLLPHITLAPFEYINYTIWDGDKNRTSILIQNWFRMVRLRCILWAIKLRILWCRCLGSTRTWTLHWSPGDCRRSLSRELYNRNYSVTEISLTMRYICIKHHRV